MKINFESFDDFNDELLRFSDIYEVTQNKTVANFSQVSESQFDKGVT